MSGVEKWDGSANCAACGWWFPIPYGKYELWLDEGKLDDCPRCGSRLRLDLVPELDPDGYINDA